MKPTPSFTAPNPTRVKCPECADCWFWCGCVAPYKKGRTLAVGEPVPGGFTLSSDRNGMAS